LTLFPLFDELPLEKLVSLPSNETWGWKLILANCFSIY
jgi:hypothetical protein